nr:MAG TPA: hypothetical protein [Bacteriophage sp.]
MHADDPCNHICFSHMYLNPWLNVSSIWVPPFPTRLFC